LEQAHRAERNAAVAAASILARAEFLLRLRELSERYEVELRKGAGAPTDKAALQFAHQHGRDALGEVAKLHFKNTLKLEARL
ncbi:MAG: ribonuclease HIII, partial [Planctomycetota bacterium]|nr:ribonuclease HIII [Planctomycetota bacterium]